MKSAGITVIALGAIVAGIAGYEGLKWYARHRQPTAAEVKAEVDSLRAEAAKQHPGMSQTDAMKQVAQAKATEMLNDADARTRRQMAAQVFYGAYFLNTRFRPAYCTQLGVDIAPFVAAYNQAHADELTRAQAVFAGTGQPPEAILTVAGAELTRMAAQDMRDIGAAQHAAPDATCRLFNENASTFASAIALPPQVRTALMTD